MTLAKIHQELGKLKEISDKAHKNYRDFLEDDGKKFNMKTISKTTKDALTSKIQEYINTFIHMDNAILGLNKALKEAETYDYENLAKNVLEKYSTKLINDTKIELVEQAQAKQPKPKKVPISNENQVLVIKDINKKDLENGKSFSEVLKKNLSEKLEGIPVMKTTVNREGNGILIFPSAESCNEAEKSLQPVYNVSKSDRKQNILQPRIKINHIDPSLTQIDKNELQAMIVSKNDALKAVTENEFQITYIDANQNYAIAKVSPDIHKSLINGRVFIGLRAYTVSEHFHPIQCFRCQSFGHTSTSPLCNAKDNPQEISCLYCSKNHKSSECPNKKNKKAHKCTNCQKSMNQSIKTQAGSHTSSSKSCPIYIKEVERIKQNTCYDQQVFVDSKNQQTPPRGR